VLGDRLTAIVRDTDDHDTQRVLLGLDAAFDAVTLSPTRLELRAVAQAVLATVARRWDRAYAPVPVAAMVAWLELAGRAGRFEPVPHLERTWFAVLPPPEGEPSDDDLRLADDWLWLVQVLYDNRPEELEPLDFPDGHQERLDALEAAVEHNDRPLADTVRRRLATLYRLEPDLGGPIEPEPTRPELPSEEPEPVAWRYHSTVARILRDL
jgi:hypothetical protein